jgi:hypothetical protein
MEEMKPQQESTATVEQPEVLTHENGVASEVSTNGEADAHAAPDASAEVIQPRPAPPMDWKRFGAPLTVLMALTIGLVLAIQFMPRPKPMQAGKTLDKIPATLGEWSLMQEYPMSDAALNELKPDEYVARIYVNSSGEQQTFRLSRGRTRARFITRRCASACRTGSLPRTRASR